MKKNTKPPVKWSYHEHGVSPSMLTLYQECKEQFRLCTQCWHPRYTTPAAAFGSVCHFILERSTFAKPTRRNMKRWIDKWTEDQLIRSMPRLTKEKEEIHRIVAVAFETMLVYHDWWSEDLAERKNLAAEQQFHLPYGDTWLNGTLDLAFNWGGNLWLEDTKTGGMAPEVQQQAFPWYTQFMTYMVAAKRIYGKYPKGIVLNQIRRSGLKTNKETIPENLVRIRKDIEKRPKYHFQKWNAEYEPREIEKWQENQLSQMLGEIRLWARGHIPHYVSPAALTRWNRKCDYFNAIVYGNFDDLVCNKNAHWLRYVTLRK